jgi:hypothetical protein
MATRLALPFHPGRLEARHPRPIEDLRQTVETGGPGALAAAIEMLRDLHRLGNRSRFARKLQGVPLWELKPRSRGGRKGGVRVVCTSIETPVSAMLFDAEVKSGVSPNAAKLREALENLTAFRQGAEVGL